MNNVEEVCKVMGMYDKWHVLISDEIGYSRYTWSWPLQSCVLCMLYKFL